MKNSDSFTEFGNISDKYITGADIPSVKKKRGGAKRFIGAAACIVLLAGAAFGVYRFILPHGVSGDPNTIPPKDDISATAAPDATPQAGFADYSIASPVLPEFPPYADMQAFLNADGEYDYEAWELAYDKWQEAKREISTAAASYKTALDGFTEKSIKEFVLKNADKNCVFSPVNVYLALSMCAELANGETREQISALLEENDIAAVRENASALFKKTYCDDGAYICIPANSVWLNDSVLYKNDTLRTLSDVYSAYSFSGIPGTAEYDGALHDWLNYATGNLLQDSVDKLKMSPEMVMTLVSSLYLSAGWQSEFSVRNTEKGIFHAPSGDVERDFMRQGEQGDFYYADDFTAKQLLIEGGGAMWIILPDADKSVEKVLKGDDFYSFIRNPSDWSQKKWCYVKMKLPKIDVSSDLDLKEGLENMGVTDLFASGTADFSNLTDNTADASGVYVDKIQHSARVKTDEEGITAAAFTVVELCGAAMPNDETDFIVDRPFIFAVTGTDGSVLFCGTVNEP